MYFFSCFLQYLMMYGKFQFYAPCIQDQQDSPSHCSSNFCHLQLFYAFSHPVLRKRKGKLLLPRQFFTLCFSYYSDGKLNQYDINRKRNDDTVPPQKKVCNKKRYSVFWQLNLNKTKQKINKSRENLFSVQLPNSLLVPPTLTRIYHRTFTPFHILKSVILLNVIQSSVILWKLKQVNNS